MQKKNVTSVVYHRRKARNKAAIDDELPNGIDCSHIVGLERSLNFIFHLEACCIRIIATNEDRKPMELIVTNMALVKG